MSYLTLTICQIFLRARDLSEHVGWLNEPAKTEEYRHIRTIFSNSLICAKMCSDLILFIPWTSSSSSYALGKQFGVYPSVKTCEIFLCFVAIVRVRVMLTSLFFCFVLRHWWVSQVFTPRMVHFLLLGTINVRVEISEHIFVPIGGYCLFSNLPVVILKDLSTAMKHYYSQVLWLDMLRTYWS